MALPWLRNQQKSSTMARDAASSSAAMRVELAVDALEIANQVDNITLFSGDGDFCSLLEAVQRRGVHVTVISSLRSKPPMIADELRRQADTFIEMDDLKAAIGRTLNTVPPRAA